MAHWAQMDAQDPLAGMGQRLAEARIATGLSQIEVARRLGMERPQTIGDWETGRYGMRADSLASLCRLYRVSADWVLGLSETPKVGGIGGVINLAVERAILRATTAQQVETEARRLDALKPPGILFGFRVPAEFEVLSDEEWRSRSHAITLKLKRLAHHDPGSRDAGK